ncbi:MAG: hypothetical protein LUH01_19425, partial [Parabacteroides gordonii]|nr:hypothetical protein [Parabacteroides gordonii]
SLMSVRKKLLSFLLNFSLKESQKDPNPIFLPLLKSKILLLKRAFLLLSPYFINKGRKIKKN